MAGCRATRARSSSSSRELRPTPPLTLHRIVERIRTKEAEAKKGRKREGSRCAAPRTSRSRSGQPRGALRPAGSHRAGQRAAAGGLSSAAPRRRSDGTRAARRGIRPLRVDGRRRGRRRSLADTFQSIVTRERITRVAAP